MGEEAAGRPGEWEGVAGLPHQTVIGLDPGQIVQVEKGDVGRIGTKTGLLGDDDHHTATIAEIGEIDAEQSRGVVGSHVLQDMCEEETVVSAGNGIGPGGEFVTRIGGETVGNGDFDRMRVDIDPNTVPIEMLKVATDPAADIEDASLYDPANVASVWRLGTDQPFPTLVGLRLKTGGVVPVGGSS